MEFLPCQLRSKNDQVVPKFWKNEVKRRDLAQHFKSRRYSKTKWCIPKICKNETERSETFFKFYKIEAKRTSSLVIVKKRKNEKNQNFVFLEQSKEKRILSFLSYRRFAITNPEHS
jgi:hypothetical protein